MIVDVGIEFRPKISKGRRYRVETQLTVTAQGSGLHIHSNICLLYTSDAADE